MKELQTYETMLKEKKVWFLKPFNLIKFWHFFYKDKKKNNKKKGKIRRHLFQRADFPQANIPKWTKRNAVVEQGFKLQAPGATEYNKANYSDWFM